MRTILKAFVIIALMPFALCIGIYGCTALNVAAVHQTVSGR